MVLIAEWYIQVAERIRPTVDRYQAAFPALLEIPSKEHPYGKCRPSRPPTYLCLMGWIRVDPAKDSVLKRVQKLRGD